MAIDEKSRSPLLTKKSPVDLESPDIILPPLNLTNQSRESRSDRYGFPWKRVLVSTVLVLTVATLLCIVLVVLSSSRFAARPHAGNYSYNVGDFENSTLDDDDEGDGEGFPSDFRRDLRRHYDRIMDEHEPEELKTLFEEIFTEATEGSFEDFVVTLDSDRLDAYRGRLSDADVEYAVNATRALRDWYLYLHEVTTRLTDYSTQKQLANLSGRSNKELFIAMPRVKMNSRQSQEISEVYKEWLRPMEVKTRKNALVFSKKIVLLSEVANMIATGLYFPRGSVFVHASHTLYLDVDLHLPETNLALIAPRWSFTGNVTIVLSGMDAREHANRTAEPETDGLPGRHGGDGGNFFGIGHLNDFNLRVYSDGGKGGDGQNGADGRDGVATEEFTKSSECIQPFHDGDHYNKYGEFIAYYKVFNAVGCGGNGRDGGVPGDGGKGGHVVVVNTATEEARFRTGKNGEKGKAGRGGAAGKGASTGCFFYASGANGKDLEAISNVICGQGVMPSGDKGRDSYAVGEEPRKVAEENLPQDALQEYRFFARREYLNGDVALADFLDTLDSASQHFGGASIPDLVEELDSIDESGKVEFYESLNRRIEFDVRHSREDEYRAVLRQLLAVSHGRMTTAKMGTSNYLILDLGKYLDVIWEDVKVAVDGGERTAPILSKILTGKVEYLKERLDRWERKARKAHEGGAGKMARLTLLAAEGLKPLCEGMMGFLSSSSMSTEGLREVLAGYDSLRNKTGRNRFEGTLNRHFLRREEKFLQDLRLLSKGEHTLSEMKAHIERLQRTMKIMNRLLPEEKDMNNFPIELENMEAVLGVVDAVRDRLQFARYLEEARDVELGVGELYDRARSMRKVLEDTLVNVHYREAVSAFRDWVFPHMYVYSDQLPKSDVVSLEEAQTGIKSLRKWVKEYRSTIVSYDKYVREAVFESNNSVGEYFKWSNEEVRPELEELFRGKAVALTADVKNGHSLAKNVIKFRTVRIEFRSRNSTADDLRSILNNVDVEMKHSGFSHYYHRGRVHVRASEGLELHYSYEQASAGSPVKCNMVYRKLMDGPPVFSPYTTWTVQLRPSSTVKGLLKFADKVDIVLVGSGSFIEVNYDDSFNT